MVTVVAVAVSLCPDMEAATLEMSSEASEKAILGLKTVISTVVSERVILWEADSTLFVIGK